MSSDPLSNVQAEQQRMGQIGIEVNGGASFENRSQNGPTHEISRLASLLRDRTHDRKPITALLDESDPERIRQIRRSMIVNTKPTQD